MDKPSLRDRILARVAFTPGATAERIALGAIGKNIGASKLRACERDRSTKFNIALAALVESGELQEYHPKWNEVPVYYPKGYALPQPKTAYPQSPVDETPKSLSNVNKRSFEQISAALWDALNHYREQGKPFHKLEVLNRAGVTSYSCLEKRPQFRSALEEAIAIQGRPGRKPCHDIKVVIGNNPLPRFKKSA